MQCCCLCLDVMLYMASDNKNDEFDQVTNRMLLLMLRYHYAHGVQRQEQLLGKMKYFVQVIGTMLLIVLGSHGIYDPKQ